MATTNRKQIAARHKTAAPKSKNIRRMPARPDPFEESFVGRNFPHALGGPRNLLAIQQIADGFCVWAESRFRTNCPSMFLAAASVTPEGIKQVVRHVARAICELAPPILPQQRKDEKSRRRSKPHAKDMVYWHICTTLNGFALLENSLKSRDWIIERAAPGTLSKIDSNQGRLTAVQALRRLKTQQFMDEIQSGGISAEARRKSLGECLRRSVSALEQFAETDLFKRPCPRENAVHARFVRALRDVITGTREGETDRKCDVVVERCDVLRAVSEQWIEECLPLQKRGRVNNQRKAAGLRWRVAYVCQYARLLRGNDSLEDLVNAVMRLRSLCETLVYRLKKLPQRRGVRSKPPNPTIFKEYDEQVLSPHIVEEWRRLLGKNASAAGALVKMAKDKEISGAWTRQQVRPRVFLGKNGAHQRIGDGKRLTAKTERRLDEAFVEGLLIPMQVAGLAARVPWDHAWRHAKNLAVPLKTHKGKKWVINPFGLLLAGDNAG